MGDEDGGFGAWCWHLSGPSAAGLSMGEGKALMIHGSCCSDPEHGGSVGSDLQSGEIPHYQRGTGGKCPGPTWDRMGVEGGPSQLLLLWLRLLEAFRRPSGQCVQGTSLPRGLYNNGGF